MSGLAPLAGIVVAALALAGCGVRGTSASSNVSTSSPRAAAAPKSSTAAARPPAAPPPEAIYPSYPRLLGSAQSTQPTGFVPAVLVHGRAAAWVARSQSGIAALSLDQSLITLRLHSGTVDAGGSGWPWGPAVGAGERQSLVAAFNGGFKLSTGAGGFMSYGRVAAPLRAGLGSIVTYADGYTDIGSWHQELPVPGRPVASVRQNLSLLIDHGAAASNLGCLSCWGATLGGISAPARSALGVTADGRLIWVGGENLTVAALTTALLGTRVVRAVELDINPEWVAAYLYGHRGGRGPLAPVSVVPRQSGVAGQFLEPYSRDFFTVQAR
jgi:hypothetical protein